MVIDKQNLDLVFNALADPTRRAMLARLSNGETSISKLGAPFNMSQPAISKHMRVLEKAGLIERTRKGREHIISIAPAPAKQAGDWIAFYTRHWEARFDAVDAYLKQHNLHNPKN
ncbi:Transcriptional regulator, ArsR family [hydrothermal vent metagenome]|uniref:Transcriptional regulator, ArsR family n=1 Tax=hydrothermal vent metagenome TaxID=652676 RepID=A0A3B0TEM5_9ZZZZ